MDLRILVSQLEEALDQLPDVGAGIDESIAIAERFIHLELQMGYLEEAERVDFESRLRQLKSRAAAAGVVW